MPKRLIKTGNLKFMQKLFNDDANWTTSVRNQQILLY